MAWPLTHDVLIPSQWLELSTAWGANCRKLVHTLDPWPEVDPAQGHSERNKTVTRWTTRVIRSSLCTRTIQTAASQRECWLLTEMESRVEVDKETTKLDKTRWESVWTESFRTRNSDHSKTNIKTACIRERKETREGRMLSQRGDSLINSHSHVGIPVSLRCVQTAPAFNN